MTIKPIQIVVAFNFTNSAEAALNAAIELAHRGTQYVFHFACIIDPHDGVVGVPPEGKIDYQYAEKVQQALTVRIHGAFTNNKVSPNVQFFVHARFGAAGTEILVLAKGVGADVVIVGNKGLTGVERILLGSVSEAVVRGAGCSVIVARPKSYPDVQLLPMIEVEGSHHYVPPHRYSYEETRLIMRPLEWPLY